MSKQRAKEKRPTTKQSCSDADIINRARELCQLAISVGAWLISLNCYQNEEHQCAICIAQQLIGEDLESGKLEIV